MYKTIKPALKRCDVSGYEFRESMVRECKHPAVLKAYGHNGIVNVSIYICKKCRFAKRGDLFDSVGCSYQEEVNQC